MSGITFGIDLGIGSCGWAVLKHPVAQGGGGEIIALGSWIFDVPETDKERTPTNQVRRGNRLLRRVIRRRRNRMAELRRLFRERGLLASDDPEALKKPGLDPWELRARGLDKALAPKELAVALGHIAKRRGFKSAAKRKTANVASDDQKMLKALEATQERLGRYRTVGEMFARDPEFTNRKRNRDGVYDRTASRDDLAHEVGVLFRKQRRLANTAATDELERAFMAIAFRQLPMQDSERLVSNCDFEKDEKRAAKLSPSFERFRLLTRLVNLRVTAGNGDRPLRPEEIALATADLGKTAILTAKRVRDRIGLADDQRFTTIKPEQESGDIAARTGEAMAGTAALRKALGEELWERMVVEPEQLDRIAHILSFFETSERISEQLGGIGLDPDVLAALTAALDAGSFGKFKGAAHISAKAARALIPHLMQGRRYDEACAAVGYNHAASSLSHLDQITDKAGFNALVAEIGESIANPIARKAMTEGLKQLWAMRNEWGIPDAIHIELARDVGNSLEQRREIEKGIDKNTADRERERQEARELLAIEDVGSDTLLRYRLWKEQGSRCLYTDRPIPPEAILATDNSVQIDHILPWSRFGDDSYNNKTLCFVAANQRKRRDTPFEWFAKDHGEAGWALFSERVETNKALRGYKKRNYLLKNAAEAEEKFRSRNLNDTRYAARLLAEAVKQFYPRGERQEKDGRRRVFTRPGALTSALRHAWGLESLKKVDGKRVDDARHHALDALVVAAVGEDEVQRLTKSFQQWEQQGLGRPLRKVDEPWNGFREQAKAALATVFVARPERRRARGEGHAATIYQVSERDDGVTVFERISVSKLGMDKGKFSETKAMTQLSRLKDLDRNLVIYESVRVWLENGRPSGTPPLSPQGDAITKVRLSTTKKPAVPVRGGTADRGEMVRVDVFAKPNRAGKNEFYYVPIYRHHVMNRRLEIPSAHLARNKAAQRLDDHHIFYRSLYPQSCVELMDDKGQVYEGYFRGLNTNTISLAVSKHHSNGDKRDGIGGKRLVTMRKYSVNRFGRRHEVKSEVRTWHGVACTSPIRPG